MGLKAFYEVLHTPSPRGKFRCNLCNGGQNLPTHPGWDRVKVSEKLAAISVALVAPVDTSLPDIAKIISVKNAWAWVSMVLYLKNK